MRLTVVPPLLLVAAAALLAVGLGPVPTDRPGAGPALVVLLDTPYDCPFAESATA